MNFKIWNLIILVVCVVSAGSLLARASVPASGIAVSSEYEVYSALIDNLFGLGTSHGKILIFYETIPSYRFHKKKEADSFIVKELRVNKDILEDFMIRDKRISSLEDHFQTSVLHQMLDRKTYKEFSDKGVAEYWKTFHEKFPGFQGIASLSAVGFDHDKTHALLYISYHCGGLCGMGQFAYLEKRAGKWNVVKVVRAWIS